MPRLKTAKLHPTHKDRARAALAPVIMYLGDADSVTHEQAVMGCLEVMRYLHMNVLQYPEFAEWVRRYEEKRLRKNIRAAGFEAGR